MQEKPSEKSIVFTCKIILYIKKFQFFHPDDLLKRVVFLYGLINL